MADHDVCAIDEIAKLLTAAWEDERKLVQRLETVQRNLQTLRRKIEAYELTLADLRTALGVPDLEEVTGNPELARAYQGLSLREMLRLWASEHGGDLVMREMTKTLVGAGFFKDGQSAAGSLYSTLDRMPEFEKLGRGHYRLKAVESSAGGDDGEAAWRAVLAEAESEQSSEPLPVSSSASWESDLDHIPF